MSMFMNDISLFFFFLITISFSGLCGPHKVYWEVLLSLLYSRSFCVELILFISKVVGKKF